MCRGWRLSVFEALVLLHGAPGRAQVPASARLRLDWSAPPDCPTRDAVLRALDRLRAPTPSGDPPRPPSMRAAVAMARREEFLSAGCAPTTCLASGIATGVPGQTRLAWRNAATEAREVILAVETAEPRSVSFLFDLAVQVGTVP